jgi:hypothetical protein
MVITLVTTLGCIAGVAVAVRNGCPMLVRAALVLALNLVACKVAVIATGTSAPTVWLLAIDIVSAFAMLWPPASRTQAILGIIYVFQIAIHCWHAAWGMVDYGIIYIAMLNVGGGLQIAFLLMGAANGDGRKVGGRRHYRGDGGRLAGHGAARVAERSGQ